MSREAARPEPQSPHESVEALARQAAGDAAARDSLLSEIRPLVCRWALIRTGDEDMAEDVAQDVLIRVHASLGSFDRRSRFTTWLYRVVSNVALDHGRRRERETARAERVATVVERDPSRRRNPASSPDAPTVQRMLTTLLGDLSPRQRAAFELVDLQGYSSREAAEMEQIDDATLRVHLSRARSAIRTAIHAGAV